MKRSEFNAIWRETETCFQRYDWSLPPKPRWDVTILKLPSLLA